MMELSYVQLEKMRFYDELDVLKKKIRDKFKCESIDEIELVISDAEKVVSQYDLMNEYYLRNLKIRLEELTNHIIKEQSILNGVQEEETAVSKSA